MQVFDTIVAGVGGMGSAALYHLARRSRKVLGIERFDIAHDRGSSHGESRIIRRAYFEHPDYVPLLHRVYDLWAELETVSGKRLVERTGLALAGPPDGEVLSGVRRAAGRYQFGIESVRPEEMATRFPGLRVSDGMEVLYESDAGFLRVEECVRTHCEQAVACGAQLRTGRQVRSWSANDAGVTVITDDERFAARELVVCGGAWTSKLLTDLALPLEVRRKVVMWFATRTEDYRIDRGCPVFGFETGGRFLYGFPEITPGEIKIADHTGGRVFADPDQLDRQLHPEDEPPVRQFISTHLPGVSSDLRRSSICMYTMTPDEHFVIDRHPNHLNVFFAAGFSGHGFKFTPIVGSVLADLVIDGKTAEPVEFLRATRPPIGL